VIQDKVATNADEGGGDEEAEKARALGELMLAEVDLDLFMKIRVNNTGNEIKHDRLPKQDHEPTKFPVVPIAQAEHGPPRLRTDEEKGGRP
jgi:hypothetical protein